jgi:hypothetical protein
MAEAPNTVGSTSLNALIKDVLHDAVVNTVPQHSALQQRIPFTQKNGRKYLVPVWLTGEHGVTYSKPDNGAFALEESVAAVSQEAQVEPYQIVEKATMSYEAAFRMDGGGRKAHVDGIKAVMENVTDSLRKRVELELLYGQSVYGLGLVNAATTASASLVVSEGSWSPGIWSGMKGAKIAILDDGLASAEDTDEPIVSVNLATRTITVTNVQTLDAGDVLFFKGAVVAGGTPTWHSMPGLEAIATNTGTLFNISAATYELWKGSTVSGVGQPTMAKIMNAVSYAVQRGCMEDLIYLCSPRQFEVLNTDLAALRRLDGSYRSSKAESGSESLTFYGQNGKLEIVPHLFVKDGDGFILPPKQMKRLGSTDITFKRPSAGGGDQMVLETSAAAGFELRAYTAQSLFCEKPAWLVKLSGITYA